MLKSKNAPKSTAYREPDGRVADLYPRPGVPEVPRQNDGRTDEQHPGADHQTTW